jgi:RNA polymerase sigma-70 factor (ECF subfamily)
VGSEMCIRDRRNHALNLMRREFREVPSEMLDLPEIGEDGKEELAQEAGKMHVCLAHLDENKRNAIMLAFMEGYTHEQVSQRLNAPLGSVKSWIRRGLLKLRECLG